MKKYSCIGCGAPLNSNKCEYLKYLIDYYESYYKLLESEIRNNRGYYSFENTLKLK